MGLLNNLKKEIETYAFIPGKDLIETNENIIVNFELPNIKKEEIDIEVTETRVKLKVIVSEGYNQNNDSVTVRRTVRLPRKVVPQKAEATFENGMLELRIPRKEIEIVSKPKINDGISISKEPKAISPQNKKFNKSRSKNYNKGIAAMRASMTPPETNPHILIRKLHSSNSAERNSAVKSLGALGPKVLNDVIDASYSKNNVIRRKTCDVLGKIDDPRSVESLIRLLSDSNRHVRRRAANALISVNDKRAIDPLIRALDDNEPKVSKRAAMALKNIPDEKSIYQLRKLLDSKNPEASQRAREILQNMGEEGIKQINGSERVKEIARQHELKNASKITTDKNLNTTNQKPSTIIDKKSLKTHSSRKDITFEDIQRMENNNDIDELIKVLSIDFEVDWEKWDQIIEDCKSLGLDDEKTKILIDSRINPLVPGQYQIRAARALSRLGDKRAIDPLINLLENESEALGVRKAAVSALCHIGGPSALEAIKRAKNDEYLMKDSSVASDIDYLIINEGRGYKDDPLY